MKRTIIIAITVLISNLSCAQDSLKIVSGPHGGTLKSVQNYKIEMLSAYKSILTYLYDKDVKPVSNKGINADIMFMYADNASINIKLKAYEDNGFRAEVVNPDYYYCVVDFHVSGKVISTRFENQFGLAQKKKKKK